MTPPRLVEAAGELLSFLDAHGRLACLIGGIVVSRWGEPRATRDVDATVLAGFEEEAAVLDLLLSKFDSRDPDPVSRVELGRLALLRASNGVDRDISFAPFPASSRCCRERRTGRSPQRSRFARCSAEDLVLYKLVAARLIDLHDVQSVVSRMGAGLDADRVRLWGGRFAEILEKPELLEPFEAALRKPGRLP